MHRRVRPTMLAVSMAVVVVMMTGCAELLELQSPPATQTPLVTVVMEPGLRSAVQDRSRLYLLIGDESQPDPWQLVRTEGQTMPLIAWEVEAFEWFWPVVVDDQSLGMPFERLSDLPAGTYWFQPFLFNGPGTVSFTTSGGLYGDPVQVEVLPGQYARARLVLDRPVPERELPAASELVESIRWSSPAFREFFGTETELEATVVLPRGYRDHPQRRYAVRYHVGPLRSSHERALELMSSGHPFAEQWLADGTPRMILVHLHSDARFGDPFQVDSANNGPWSTVVADELVAEVDARFRTVAERWARFTDGVGAGGWAALSLLVDHPDVFAGAWALCPDSVDFRALQLVDLTSDQNAFVNEFRLERPSERAADGEPRMTLLNECWREQVLGRDGRMVTSGGQWGSMNGAFSPRGDDGLPQPLWNPVTGEIDADVASAWMQRDLRTRLVEDWADSGALLRNAIHIWASRSDRFFNGRAVELLAVALAELSSPPADASIVLDPWSSECRPGLSQAELMAQMLASFEGRDLASISGDRADPRAAGEGTDAVAAQGGDSVD